ncbi:MAG: hypothetical protein HUU38_23605 [Anaerolineales bacterium]|jgi:hypothetical protein|nr:hypothetical protein [Anaerolineales bacterium]
MKKSPLILIKPMYIDLSSLNYAFQTKPLLIGGMAMEYYGLRKSGADIDFVLTSADYVSLAKKHPDHLKDLYGDLGVCVGLFELWRTIMLFGYDFLADRALEEETYRVISLEKLLFLKTLGISVPKYEQDVRLLVQKIGDIQYGKDKQFGANHFVR